MMARRGSPLHGLNKRNILRLIEGYKESCCLWEATHKDYRNKKVKSEAWGQLLKIYQEEDPSATPASIQMKIFQMRQKYARLRRRKLEEPSFVPKMWYYRHLSFLSTQAKTKKKQYQKKQESAVDVPDEDEETKFNKTLDNLLTFLPYEERPAARNLMSEITYRAKLHQTGVLKLSMRVGNNDLTLIPNAEPICSTSKPYYCGVTPKDLERQDIEETENAVRSLRFYFDEPDDNFDPQVISIDDDVLVND